ncbi:hypothetical protein ACSBR1_022553 [Camellia fascicularis]
MSNIAYHSTHHSLACWESFKPDISLLHFLIQFACKTLPNATRSYKLQSLVTVLYRYRLFTPNRSRPQQQHQLRHRDAWLSKFSYGDHSMHRGLRSMITTANSRISSTPATTDMVTKHDNNNVQPSVPPPPSKPGFPTWVKWLLGSILTLVLPFGKKKWEKLLLLEGLYIHNAHHS